MVACTPPTPTRFTNVRRPPSRPGLPAASPATPSTGTAWRVWQADIVVPNAQGDERISVFLARDFAGTSEHNLLVATNVNRSLKSVGVDVHINSLGRELKLAAKDGYKVYTEHCAPLMKVGVPQKPGRQARRLRGGGAGGG